MVKRVRRRVGRVAVEVSVGCEEGGCSSFGEEEEGGGACNGGIVAVVVRGTAWELWRRL